MQKSVGVTRKVDDLGRIVLPKELRDSMGLETGTPLEIFVDKNGEIALKRYEPLYESINKTIFNFLNPLQKVLGGKIVWVDHRLSIQGVFSSDNTNDFVLPQGFLSKCEKVINTEIPVAVSQDKIFTIRVLKSQKYNIKFAVSFITESKGDEAINELRHFSLFINLLEQQLDAINSGF